MIKKYDNVKFNQSFIGGASTVLTFWFTFDYWNTDKCIVYNTNKPEKWACDSEYKKMPAKQIQQLINRLIKKRVKQLKKIKYKRN